MILPSPLLYSIFCICSLIFLDLCLQTDRMIGNLDIIRFRQNRICFAIHLLRNEIQLTPDSLLSPPMLLSYAEYGSSTAQLPHLYRSYLHTESLLLPGGFLPSVYLPATQSLSLPASARYSATICGERSSTAATSCSRNVSFARISSLQVLTLCYSRLNKLCKSPFQCLSSVYSKAPLHLPLCSSIVRTSGNLASADTLMSFSSPNLFSPSA